MEKLNKHGLPIMNVSVKKKPKNVDNDYFCHGLDEKKCYNQAKHKRGEYKYCERCYIELLDRQYDEM